VLPTKFQLLWPNGFREDFFLFGQSQELPMAAVLVLRTARNMEILYRIPKKQQFIVPPSFRKDYLNFSQSETRIAHGDHVFYPIGMK